MFKIICLKLFAAVTRVMRVRWGGRGRRKDLWMQSEVVLVDWGSEVDLARELELPPPQQGSVAPGPQYRVFSVTRDDESKPEWVLSEAYNVAFSLVRGGAALQASPRGLTEG